MTVTYNKETKLYHAIIGNTGYYSSNRLTAMHACSRAAFTGKYL